MTDRSFILSLISGKKIKILIISIVSQVPRKQIPVNVINTKFPQKKILIEE